MSRKYKAFICIGMIAALFGFYGYKVGETRLSAIPDPAPAKKQLKTVRVEKQATNEDTVAAILIMPKSYLPALRRFAQSPMARNVKILRADLEIKDGIMTAVRQDKRVTQQALPKGRNGQPETAPPLAISHLAPNRENQIVSAGFLYLLAGISKHQFVR